VCSVELSVCSVELTVDVAGEIMLKLDRPRRHIVNKLVELGLVEDRKLLRKKRKRKSVQKEAGSSGGGE